MPSCRITNYTTQPLNVCLKHIAAIHFENEVQPGATVKLKPGRVWFTLEVLVDDKDNRYSVASSAAAIAIVSLACVGTAALAVPAVSAAGAAGTIGAVGSTIVGTASHIGSTIGTALVGSSTTVGTAVATGGAGIFAAGDTLVAGIGSIITTAQGFITAHAATVGKISAALLPKAIEIVEEEVGGFNAVQKEVISILSSPTVTSDVRESGLNILSRLGVAIAADRAAEEERNKEAERQKNEPAVVAIEAGQHRRTASNILGKARKAKQESVVGPLPPSTSQSSKDDGSSSSSVQEDCHDHASLHGRPSLKRMHTSVSTLVHKLSSEGRAQRKEAKEAAKDKEWEVCDFDPECMLSTTERVRVHGLFMNERRHFEVHEREGKLVLIDANTKEVVRA
ncbi:SubName: Full=Uncharacterized protein {ECO:0000313/EMBL:CCA70008.1} [Serendipita indica DSM 11827]|nr:SubName: Full=Uncharacterized protein {ECO:0000313/EMBL:CCA70008.1} [Serendipita indica DSM 11827]